MSTKKENSEVKIIKCEFHSLRDIAKRQILSLIRRMGTSQNYSLYRTEINRVILHERGEIKEIEDI
jgi:hypothetical protein